MAKRTLTLSLIVLLIVALPGLLISQPEVEWQRSYGGEDTDHCRDVIQTADGGYMIVGWETSFGPVLQDGWVVKTDERGESQWTQEYGGDQADTFSRLVQTSDGGYIFAGISRSYGNLNSIWVVKTDDEGDVDWSRLLDVNRYVDLKSFFPTAEDCYLLGTAHGTLAKIDEDGEMIWHSVICPDHPSQCYSYIETFDGGFAAVGYTEAMDALRKDGYLIKTDNEREVEWRQHYGDRWDDKFFDVVQTSDGGYAIVGSTLRDNLDGWLVKTDEEGELTWQRFFGGNSDATFKHIMQMEDGGFLLVGFESSNAFLVRTDSEGEELWNMYIRGVDANEEYLSGGSTSIVQTDDGGFALGCISGQQRGDFSLTKISPDPILLTPLWLTLPDTSFAEDDSLILASAFLYEYIEDRNDPDSTLEISSEDGAHLFAGLDEESLVITSDENWWGTDSLRLTVTDPDEQYNTTYLKLTVTPVNDPPDPFVLINPENEQVLNSSWVVFVWDEAEQNRFEIDTVHYSLQFFSGDHEYEISGINATFYMVRYIEDLLDSLGHPEIEDDIDIIWSVTAFDDSSSTECDEMFMFTIPSLWIGGPEDELVPLSFSLHPAYPNPFNSTTTIRYELPYPSPVSLKVYNPFGQQITTLFEGYRQAGVYSANLNASNLVTGLYFIRLEARVEATTQKVMMIR